MPLFIPLGDFVQRLKLVFGLFIGVAVALLLSAAALNLLWLTAASFLVGLTALIAQILIGLRLTCPPLTSSMAKPWARSESLSCKTRNSNRFGSWPARFSLRSAHFGGRWSSC